LEGLDIVALVLAILLAAAATAEGVKEGNTLRDADEIVFQTTLHDMQAGRGYYPSMRDALIAKEHQAPTQIRAIRPPTLFLLLRPLPERSWRLVVGLVYLAVLLGAWRLGRPFGRYGGTLAVIGGGVWLLAFADFLYLHAELWGLPFLIWGAVAVRSGDDVPGAVLLGLAVCFRELFGIAFVLAAVIRRFRRPWIAATVVLAVLTVIHAHFADEVLGTRGHEAALGNEKLTLRFALRVISPGTGTANFIFGVAVLVLAVAGLVLAARDGDRAAWVIGPFVLFMVPAAVLSTRIYWSAAWAVPATAFAPAAVDAVARRYRSTRRSPTSS
jgi:hypothetical protein